MFIRRAARPRVHLRVRAPRGRRDGRGRGWPGGERATRTRPHPGPDQIGRAAAHGSLANVAYQRFLDARAAGAPDTELLTHLNAALTGHQQALDLLPADHHDYRATADNQLAVIFRQAGDVRQALHHYQESIQHQEARGGTYGAGQTRYNIVLLLESAGRPGDALHYARAALANYRTVGPAAATETDRAQALIDELTNKR